MGRILEGEIVDKLQEKLRNVLSEIDGSCDAFFSGYDGMIITRYTNIKTNLDADLICANFVSVIKIMRESGSLKDIIVSFEKHTLIIKVMEDGFVCIIIGVDGNLGRAKLEASKLSKNFLE